MRKYALVIFSGAIIALMGLIFGDHIHTPTRFPIQPTNTTAQQKNPSQVTTEHVSNKNVNSDVNNQENDIKTLNSTTSKGKEPRKEIVYNGKTYPNRIYETLMTPNDPYYNQWWTSSNSMNQFWDITPGSYQTKIAIIDTGFALKHQEFINRWAINNNESGPTTEQNPSRLNCSDQSKALDRSCNLIDDNYDGVVDNESGPTTEQNPSRLNCSDQNKALDKNCNNIDDDNNGYIDDVTGWDFSNGDNNVQAGEINPTGSSITHGTMTTGIMASTGNNNVGIAGVDWYSKILPIQALDDDGYGDSFTVGQAIYYAVNQGADLISISLGTNTNDPYLREAIYYAIDHSTAVVAASGNNGCNCISYPANYPEVIAVGAIDPSNNISSFSNFGNNLDILAPGQNITTPTYSSSNPTNLYAVNVAGTSFATPFVSGILAMAKSYQPNAKWDEIVGAMLEKTDKTGLSTSAPRTDKLGFGIAMANNILSRAKNSQTFSQQYRINNQETKGSKLSYFCNQDQLPGAILYEMSKSGTYRYTSSSRELSIGSINGWSSRQLAYTCFNLPTDNTNVIRELNLPVELNTSLAKFW